MSLKFPLFSTLKWRQVSKHIRDSFLHFLYPSLCLECREVLSPGRLQFCEECFEEFQFIDPDTCCPFCFSEDFEKGSAHCRSCFKKKSVLHRVASAFDYKGPPATLITKMKYEQQPYLAKGAAAFLVMQWLRLEWPVPDVVVPVPISWSRSIDRGYNQSFLIAQEFAKSLNFPLKNVLKKSSVVLSQAGLSHDQRLQLSSSAFSLRKKGFLEDKCVLIIDDVMTTGRTLQCCAEAMLEDYPKSIYGLTVCRSM